ncbi:unnamed protein product [Calicophoron daubneyi]|uniref:RBR-type E3 ubiquitin transferase n=1 Tax=Calicophoron daubneyi TaxID=300641 RepID=A0AAV2TPM1_CALDB
MGNVENKAQVTGSASRRRRRNSLRRLAHRAFPGRHVRAEAVGSHDVLTPVTDHNGECPVCCEARDILLRFSPCSHMACTPCWLTFICTEIGSFSMARLTCIACRQPLDPTIVVRMLSSATKDPESFGIPKLRGDEMQMTDAHILRMLSRYEEFLLRRALANESDARWCPYGCGYGLIARGFKSCPRIFCLRPGCPCGAFCYNCQRPWSANGSQPPDSTSTVPPQHVCAGMADERKDLMGNMAAFFGYGRTHIPRPSTSQSPYISPADSVTVSERAHEDIEDDLAESRPFVPPGESKDADEMITPVERNRLSSLESENDQKPETASKRLSADTEIKPCPNCHALIQKVNDGSCNVMSCSLCGYTFCWLCMRENTVGHFVSLSGCTIWGKKRWTPRRRILILIGLLLGTPILLPLLLGLAIPAGAVSLTVLFCYGTTALLHNANKHLRRLTTLFVCLLSLLVTPVLAASVAVISVPILLGYVYVYLPINVLIAICSHSDKSIPAEFPNLATLMSEMEV